MAYPEDSDFQSPTPNAAWFMVNVPGNKRVVCSSTGYALATIAMSQIREIQRRYVPSARGNALRDWSGVVVPPLQGDVSFNTNMQRALYALTSASPTARASGLPAMIRGENRIGVFGQYSMTALLNILLRLGQWTSGVSLTEGTSYLPSNWIPPVLNAPLTRSPNPTNPVCNVIEDSAPVPASTQQTTAAVANTPATPAAEPANKGPNGDKGVFDPMPEDPSTNVPPQGNVDAQGNYVPSANEYADIIPMPGVVLPSSPTVPPPPSNITFITSGGPSSGSSTGTFLVVAAIGLAVLYALSQSSSYSEQTTTVRRNPRRKKRPARTSRRR